MSEAQVNQKSIPNSKGEKMQCQQQASRQEKSKANSRQEKSIANSRQKKNKKTCEKPKAESEEHMEHTEGLHIQHKVNEEYTKNTLKTENRRNRASPWRTRSSKWRLIRKCLRRH